MSRNKNFIFILFFSISIPSFAQGIIYKCTDDEGNTTYINETNISGKNCEKTNLAKIDRGNTLNKPTVFVDPNQPKQNNTPITNIDNSEQIIRDQKRKAILQEELNQERTQLKTVTDMLKNIKEGNEGKEFLQLKKMEEAHKRNIAALEKDIGLKEVPTNPTQANSMAPKGLPFTLPTDVQLVTPPNMPQAMQPNMGQNQVTQNNSISQQNIKTNTPNINEQLTKPEEPIKKVEIVRESYSPLITNKSLKNQSFMP
jgi:hypothetical protein